MILYPHLFSDIERKYTDMLNSMIEKTFNSKPLNGRKNKARGIPKNANKTLPHIGQPAENKPVINPPKLKNPVLDPFFVIFTLYMNTEIKIPNKSEITASKKSCESVYQNPDIMIKIFKLWLLTVATVSQ